MITNQFMRGFNKVVTYEQQFVVWYKDNSIPGNTI